VGSQSKRVTSSAYFEKKTFLCHQIRQDRGGGNAQQYIDGGRQEINQREWGLRGQPCLIIVRDGAEALTLSPTFIARLEVA
jgi:hypothetical protein